MSPSLVQGRAPSRTTSLELLDAKEKKKMQNRIAQRTYRKNQKQRIQALENAVAQSTPKPNVTMTDSVNIQPENLQSAPSEPDMSASEPCDFHEIQAPSTEEHMQIIPTPELSGIWDGIMAGQDLPSARPALHRAASRGDESMCRLLICRGADLGRFDGNGSTALHVAVAVGNEAIVRQMLEKDHVNLKDVMGRTALFQAVQSKNERIMRLLLDYKVDVDSRDVLGEVALHHAVDEGSESIVSVLLEHGANIDA